jgi:hypothetical protein
MMITSRFQEVGVIKSSLDQRERTTKHDGEGGLETHQVILIILNTSSRAKYQVRGRVCKSQH